MTDLVRRVQLYVRSKMVVGGRWEVGLKVFGWSLVFFTKSKEKTLEPAGGPQEWRKKHLRQCQLCTQEFCRPTCPHAKCRIPQNSELAHLMQTTAEKKESAMPRARSYQELTRTVAPPCYPVPPGGGGACVATRFRRNATWSARRVADLVSLQQVLRSRRRGAAEAAHALTGLRVLFFDGHSGPMNDMIATLRTMGISDDDVEFILFGQAFEKRTFVDIFSSRLRTPPPNSSPERCTGRLLGAQTSASLHDFLRGYDRSQAGAYGCTLLPGCDRRRCRAALVSEGLRREFARRFGAALEAHVDVVACNFPTWQCSLFMYVNVAVVMRFTHRWYAPPSTPRTHTHRSTGPVPVPPHAPALFLHRWLHRSYTGYTLAHADAKRVHACAPFPTRVHRDHHLQGYYVDPGVAERAAATWSEHAPTVHDVVRANPSLSLRGAAAKREAARLAHDYNKSAELRASIQRSAEFSQQRAHPKTLARLAKTGRLTPLPQQALATLRAMAAQRNVVLAASNPYDAMYVRRGFGRDPVPWPGTSSQLASLPYTGASATRRDEILFCCGSRRCDGGLEPGAYLRMSRPATPSRSDRHSHAHARSKDSRPGRGSARGAPAIAPSRLLR